MMRFDYHAIRSLATSLLSYSGQWVQSRRTLPRGIVAVRAETAFAFLNTLSDQRVSARCGIAARNPSWESVRIDCKSWIVSAEFFFRRYRENERDLFVRESKEPRQTARLQNKVRVRSPQRSYAGSRTVNVEPSPTADFTSIVPPMRPAKRRER